MERTSMVMETLPSKCRKITLLLEFNLRTMTLSSRVWFREGKEGWLQSTGAWYIPLSLVIKMAPTVTCHYNGMSPQRDVRKMAFASIIFPQNTHNPILVIRKMPGKSRWRDLLQPTSPVLLQTIKVVRRRQGWERELAKSSLSRHEN